MLFLTLIIVITFAVAIITDYTAKIDGKPSKHNVLKAVIFALIVIIIALWKTYISGTKLEDAILAFGFIFVFISPLVYFVILVILDHVKKLNKAQRLNFFSFAFVAVILVGTLIYGEFTGREKPAEPEAKKIEAIPQPAETKPKETRPENKYGRYEKMEDGSTQFVYYSHKAMVEDYGYDPCHKPGDMDFEAPDSWAWDDWSEQYYRPGEIIWHDDLDSSAISEVGYDFEKEVLYVVFKKNDALYAYYDVPWDVWEDFLYDDSMGAYLNKNIKGKYEYERID